MRVRAARVAAGLTIRELAIRVGMCEVSFIYLEWGDKHPEAELVRRIAAALGIDSRALANGDES
jgi:transcriptional regulator with XRE-family HTH domain